MKTKRKWLLALLVAVIICAAYLFWQSRPDEVSVAPVRRGTAVELVYATGFVEPEQPVSVQARLTAPVTRVLADEGDSVRRGQALLALDDVDQRETVREAAARRRGADLAEQRILALYKKGWVTRAARDQTVADAAAARAAERAALARLEQHVIRAGIDGLVVKRDVEPGDLAAPSRVLMLLGDPAEMRVTAIVDERDVPRIEVGQSALLSSDAWPGRVIRGHVRELTPAGDPDQRAFRVRLGLDESEPLPIGMTLEINIVVRKIENALLIPRLALQDSHVWVARDGRAAKRQVRTGIGESEHVQVTSGLAEGDSVILSPPSDLEEGERVRPVEGE